MKYFFGFILACFSAYAWGQPRAATLKRAESLVKNSPEYKKIKAAEDPEQTDVRLQHDPNGTRALSDTIKFEVIFGIQGIPCAGYHPEYSIYYSIRRNKIIGVKKEE